MKFSDQQKKYLIQNWQVFAFLTFLVFGCYFNSLDNDFVADDIPGIVNNQNLDNFSLTLSQSFNRLFSLQPILYFFINQIFGRSPAAFRFFNILSHLGVTIIVYFLVYLLINYKVALLSASLMAVHPLLTESVTWISGGYYSHSAFFALLSFLTYVLSLKNNQPKYYLGSIFFFFLALSASEKVIIFPLVLLLYELYFGRLKTNWKKLIPFLGLSLVWGLFFLGAIKPRVVSLEKEFYQKPQTVNPLVQIPIAITSYLELIFWPKNLTLYHSEMSFTQGEYLLRLIIFIIFLGIIAYNFKRNQQVFFWLSFFIISLLPTLTPFGISWIVAERYVYLATLGITIPVALAIQKISQIFKNKNVSYAILGIILIALSIRTIVRNNDWQNQDTLWLAAAKTSPSSPQNHNNLGDLYGRRGDFEKSIYHFQKAIELKPGYADAYHNLGNTYQQIGEVEQAIENYQKALSFNPNLWQSYQALAAIYFNQEKYDLAEQEMKKAIEVNPQNANLYTNLGIVYLKLDKKEKAKQSFQKALQLNPQDQRAKQFLLQIK